MPCPQINAARSMAEGFKAQVESKAEEVKAAKVALEAAAEEASALREENGQLSAEVDQVRVGPCRLILFAHASSLQCHAMAYLPIGSAVILCIGSINLAI